MKKATILVSLNNGIAVRNIMQTDVFRILQRNGIKIVLLTPNAEDDSFRYKYRSKDVYFEKMKLDKYKIYFSRSRIQQRLSYVRWFTLNGRYNISTISDWYKKVYKKERPSRRLYHKLANFIEDILINLLRRSAILRKLLIHLEYLFFTPSFHRDIFLQYRPQWVLVTSLGMGNQIFDAYIIREARRHRAKVISLILSWDNTTTRGMRASFADKVVAWTDIMKKELIELHDIKPEKIFVGGVTQFDHYYHKESIYTREDFLRRFGLSTDSNRKLIFFATKSPTAFPSNPDIVEIIAEAIEKNKFAFPCQLLVRLHPNHFVKDKGSRFKHSFDRYKEISTRYKHVIFNIPSFQSKVMDWDVPETELFDVASILYYADVMVDVFSTMNLEASIFDLPTVNVCFEGPADKQYPARDIWIDVAQTHNQRIINTGGIRLAYHKDELIELINTYLKNPAIDKEGRLKIAKQECGPNPGEASRVIGEYILGLLRENKSRC